MFTAIDSSITRLATSPTTRRQPQAHALPTVPQRAPALTPDERTHQAIRALIGGAHPDEFAATPLRAFGGWGPIVKLLFDAHAEGESGSERGGPRRGAGGGMGAGTDAVVRTYSAIVCTDDAFARLMTVDAPAPRTCYTMAELLTGSYPPPDFIVPGMIPVGLSSVAGRPKLGKSWLVLQLALAAVTGGEFLGVCVPKIKVSYLALEDSELRLADRLKKQTRGMDVDLDDAAEAIFYTACPPAGEGGYAVLRELIVEQGFKLVIVDTTSRFLGRADQMDNADMTRLLGALQRLAIDHQAAILLVDHHRKSARTSLDADPIDDILGSTAKAGVVDCALGLYRRHNEDEGTLKLSGRDFGDQELALQWDPATFRWHVKTPIPATMRLTVREQETLDAVVELCGGGPRARAGGATLGELAAHTGHNKGSLYTRLQNLTTRGAISQHSTTRGLVYTPAGVEAVETVEAIEAVAAVEAVEMVEAVEAVEAVETVETIEAVRALNSAVAPGLAHARSLLLDPCAPSRGQFATHAAAAAAEPGRGDG